MEKQDKNQLVVGQAKAKPAVAGKKVVSKKPADQAKNKKIKKAKPVIKKEKTTKKGLKINFWIKDILLAIVNIAFIVALVFLLGELPKKALELKKLKNDELEASVKSKVQIAEYDLLSSGEKADDLAKLLPDDEGLIEFVKEIDKLKEAGLVTRFSFASEQAVKDNNKNFGIPLIIEFSGTWAQISDGLQRLEGLPYLLRAISIEVRKNQEGILSYKYGGFLYVSETLAKN
jgi:Tfp pilus assembly protein PilO